MAELHRTEVDGVTTIWADAPAPLRAGLLFRTGRVDEPVTAAGYTHLIEHMALSATGHGPQTCNAYVAAGYTGFVVMGGPEEVSAFLLRCCESLTALPGDRLEAEKDVLSAEDAARGYDLAGNLLMRRYGAAGYGRVGLPELGLQTASLEQLREYAAHRFTSGNAVLWLSGPPPGDIRLPLPAGEKVSLPPLEPIRVFPSWFVDDACGGVACGAVVPRIAASAVFAQIASKRLLERLRTADALSYSPGIAYDPLDAEAAHLILYADSDSSRRRELAGAFGEAFEGLARIDEAEVEAAKSQLFEQRSGSLAPPPADMLLQEVQRAALEWLLGREYESIEAIDAETSAVGVAEVEAVSAEVRRSAIFAVPAKADVQAWMGEHARVSTTPMVEGREEQSLDARHPERLVHSAEGVSLRWPDASHLTVRYSELVAALVWEDGCVRLLGADAASVCVEPTLWRNGQAICREIRDRVPGHLVLDQGERPAEAIPRPVSGGSGRGAVGSRVAGSLLLVFGGLGAAAWLLVTVIASGDLVAGTSDPVEMGITVGLMAAPFIVCAVMLLFGLRMFKRGLAGSDRAS